MRVLTTIIVLLLLALFGYVCGVSAVNNYKSQCEVIGFTNGHKWRECAL